MGVIDFDLARGNQINVSMLSRNTRSIPSGLISTNATTDSEELLAVDHTSEPIKKLEDIFAISDYLISSGRYRDNMLFIVGINFGLRVSDLRELRFSNLINPNLTFKDSFAVFEKKTRNTRHKKKNRYVTINDAVVQAVTLYLEHTEGVCLNDYLFKSESNRGANSGKPLTPKSIDRILKGVSDDLNLNIKMSTHTLRKTFCYWMMISGNGDQRRLFLLQRMLNHSSPLQTLDYIGLTSEEICDAYTKLNLGLKKYNRGFLVDSCLEERDAM